MWLLSGIPAALVPAIFLLCMSAMVWGDRLRTALPSSLRLPESPTMGFGALLGLLAAGLLMFLPAVVWNRGSAESTSRTLPRALLERDFPRRGGAFLAVFIGYQLMCIPLIAMLSGTLLAQAELLAGEMVLVALFLGISYRFSK